MHPEYSLKKPFEDAETDHPGEGSSLQYSSPVDPQRTANDHPESEMGEKTQDPFLDHLFKKFSSRAKVPRRISSRFSLRGKKKLGQGGLGEVYAFYDQRLRRAVALKVARPHVIESQSRLDRFLRERKLSARLQHPAIPPVYMCGELSDGRPYYTMRLIEGKNLTQRIREFHLSGSNQTPANDQFGQLLDSFQQICDALEYAHHQNIVHRDLKPANVMVEEDGTTFLVDWGLAREIRVDSPEDPSIPAKVEVLADTDQFAMTQDGQQLGSPEFMSPEQASGSPNLHSPLTDVYGLGAILFQIISGMPPHAKKSEKEQLQLMLSRISTSAPPDATAYYKQASPEIASICQKAMALNPSDRYQSPSDLKKDLLRWRRRDMVAAHKGNYSLLQRLELTAGKHRRAISLTIIMLAVLFFGATWATFQVSNAAERTEEALQKQRQTNEQLLSSLEKFADAVMEDDVLATPQLSALRNRLLSDLTEQYQLFIIQNDNSQQETLRAARGTLRLARIDRETGNLLRAINSGVRAIEFARMAVESSPQNNLQESQLVYLDSLLGHSEVLVQAGELQEAEESLQPADQFLGKLNTELPADHKLERLVRISRLQVSLAYRKADRAKSPEQRTHQFEQALMHCESALNYQQQLQALHPGSANVNSLISVLNNKALVLHKLYHLEDAIKVYEEAIKLIDQRLAEARDDEKTKLTEMKSGILFNAIMSYRAARDWPKVRVVGSQGLELSRQLKDQFPLVINYPQEYARACGNYAEAEWYAYLDAPEENADALEIAIDVFRSGAEQYRELARVYPERRSFRGEAAIQYLRLSMALFWTGRMQEAQTAFQICLEMSDRPEELEPLHGPNAFATLTGYCQLCLLESPARPLKHPTAKHFDKLLKIAVPTLTHAESPYARRFLEDPVYRNFLRHPEFQRVYNLATEALKTPQHQ